MVDGVVRRIVLGVLLVVDPGRELGLLHRLVGVRVLPFPGQHRGLGDLLAASISLVLFGIFYVGVIRFSATFGGATWRGKNEPSLYQKYAMNEAKRRSS